MKRRKVCKVKGCNKTLAGHNKSGLCYEHYRDKYYKEYIERKAQNKDNVQKLKNYKGDI